jgi:multidrug efflux pump subunit AcrA (membrane-fusion protein)
MAIQPYLGESLLAPGLIRLFGREFEGLILGKEHFDRTSNNPIVLQEQIDGLARRLDDIQRGAPKVAASAAEVEVARAEAKAHAIIRAADAELRAAKAKAEAAVAAAEAEAAEANERDEAARRAEEAAAIAQAAAAEAARDAEAAVAAGRAMAADPHDDPDERRPQDGIARLARIYGFSYLGNYYKIANPPVLRVHGQGFRVRSGFLPENHMDILGVEFKDEDFVRGIRMWPSDHLDVAVRIDITIGWLREILLDPDMCKDTNVTANSSGGRADVVGRDSGLVGRDSGLVGRDSGLVGRSRR